MAEVSREKNASHLDKLHTVFQKELTIALGDRITFNGINVPHIPGCLSITFDGIDAEDLLHELSDLALSTGSACSSRHAEPSHVLFAMGRSATEAAATIRMGLGRSTSLADVHFAAEQISRGYRKLRR